MSWLHHHRRYTDLRRTYLAAYNGAPIPCALCGQPVWTSLPGRHPWGPTIEHREPIRHILATSTTRAEALARACDTTTWAIAHLTCQHRQGGHAAHNQRPPTTHPSTSRHW